MTKFTIDELTSGWVTFRAEIKPGDGTTQSVYFKMWRHKWEEKGRPTELLITVEGVTV